MAKCRPASRHTSEQRREFSRRIGEVARLWRGSLDRELKPLGLSFMQWLTLSQLAVAGEDLVQKDLAARVSIEGPAMVGVLDRLVRAGLVERRVSPTDRRANTIHLTDAGVASLEAAEHALENVRVTLLQDLDDRELEQATNALQLIVERGRSR